jgi:hypothetical protein
MPADHPLARLDRQELLWLAGILKDACRERLEKNLVSQAFEERLYRRGPVEGRLDPRPFLKIWEPRYRKFLEVAGELQSMLEAEDARAVAESLKPAVEISRHGPASVKLSESAGARRRSRSR